MTRTDYYNAIIKAHARMSDAQFLTKEFKKWIESPLRKEQLQAHQYYRGDQDILENYQVYSHSGKDVTTEYDIPKSKVVDNQFSIAVDQKVNYLFGLPFAIEADNKEYLKHVEKQFGKRFRRTLKVLAQEAIQAGVGYLYPYYDNTGEFRFKVFRSYDIHPFWADTEHTELDAFGRYYTIESYEGERERLLHYYEFYDRTGWQLFEYTNGTLMPQGAKRPHFSVDGEPFVWSKVPLVAFKANPHEISMLKRTKTLQDGINTILTVFENNVQESPRNAILVLNNYDGEDLIEFRQNLKRYGAVKTRSDSGGQGGVSTLSVEIKPESYKLILSEFKRAFIANARSYDAKDERMSTSPNQMNIQSMYSDIDLDSNGIETEFQASFEELLWFFSQHLANNNAGNFTDEKVTFVFNRDVLVNEGEVIDLIAKSVGILSHQTLIAQHPWVENVEEELRRIEEEKKKAQEEQERLLYGNAFGQDEDEDEYEKQGD